MDQFIREIEEFCAAAGIRPERLLRETINAQWGQWARWRDGKSSPTMIVADRIRRFMRENPPETFAGASRKREPAR